MAQLILIWQLLSAVAPLLNQLYEICKAMFPDAPGMVKLEAFRSLLQQTIATSEELKQYEPVFAQAWPLIKTLVDALHAFKSPPVTLVK